MIEEKDGHKVGQFGVSGVQSERDWPYLSFAEIAAIVSSYNAIGCLKEILWHSRRPYSAAALIITDRNQKFFIKRHHYHLRNKSSLEKEHAFARHLSQKGLSISQVMVTASGESVISQGEWCYEIHEPAIGEDIYRDVMSWEPFFSIDHAYAAGEMLAKFHNAAQGFKAPSRCDQLLIASDHSLMQPDFMSALVNRTATQKALENQLKEKSWQKDIEAVILPFHQQLKPFLPLIKPLWGHGDWHSSNMTWTGKGKIAKVAMVLDLGMADYTSALFDLATALERNVLQWLLLNTQKNIVVYDQLEAFLSGYKSIRPLTRTDKQILAAFLPLVHVEFALSEVVYFGALLKDYASADIAYYQYLLGHARWFSEKEGQALLQWIAAF
ncbi:MAG: phosphotransferase [Zymomonas mobilis subsp. pomaceae]|uniref:phosphotransferase enzyme family protein n=1 Tax=Zymomonas mobilis TaxID=542 RepID=UPI0039E7CE98